MSSIAEIPLQEILLATNEFADKNCIAWGGFGPVYQGKSEKHGSIAVKRLDRKYGQGDPEFEKEIALLSEYKHENIVSLLGFCDEGGEKILVYKLESNGSLDKHLDNKDLSWIQRLRICLDAARGLMYLHDDVGPQQRILHRDVKSANILLDENWNAKISDFGLSRAGPANMQTTLLISNACGTFGYIDPDYLYTGSLTQRSDVYSFGVVLFEVLCGRPTRVTTYKDECQFLTVLVTKHYGRQTLDKIIHFDIQDQIKSTSLLTFSTIAYQCLKTGSERPTMNEVVQQLQKALHNQLESSGSWPYDVYNGFGDYDDDNVDALTKPQQGNDNNVGAADSVVSCHVDADIALYKHLWRACAGPLATVPRENELVFYFFQGHIKQIEASTNQVEEQNLPLYNLPAKILCRVANVQLRVEPDTDEVFAQITLMPEQNHDETAVKKDPAPPPETQFRVHSFCKTLTASDTSMHDGFSVLRRHADECLPPLDMSRQPPAQELMAKDLHGKEWRFRHIFEGQPPRHLLESGWSVFVSSKRLVAGDAFIFLRGENGELRVGIRPAMRQRENVPSSVISSRSMHYGVLATAWHAIQTGTIFTVYYKPWTCPAEFIVPYDQYMESSR